MRDLDVSANDTARKRDDDTLSEVSRKMTDRPIMTWVGQGYDTAEAAARLAVSNEHTARLCQQWIRPHQSGQRAPSANLSG